MPACNLNPDGNIANMYFQALQKTSTEVRDLTSDLPQRETSTPLVSAPRDSINDHGPSALAPTAGNIRPKSSVPKGVATDFKIRPRTAQNVQVRLIQF